MTLRTITFDDEQWQVVPKVLPDALLCQLLPVAGGNSHQVEHIAAAIASRRALQSQWRNFLTVVPEPPAQQPMTVAELEDQSSYWHHWYLKTHEELEAIRQGWIRVVDEFLVTRHLGIASPTDTYDEARAKLLKIIDFEIDIATDPVVGGDRVRKKVPMTDEEAKALISPVLRRVPAGNLPQISTGYLIAMMRAVERHHGIGKGESNA